MSDSSRPEIYKMGESALFGRALPRLNAKLEKVLELQRCASPATPEGPDSPGWETSLNAAYIKLYSNFKVPELRSDIRKVTAPDVLFTEISFQAKELLKVLPSDDQDGVDIALLQTTVETLWHLLDTLGVEYYELRTSMTGEPKEKLEKFFDTYTELLRRRKWDLDLVRVEQEFRVEDEHKQKRLMKLALEQQCRTFPSPPVEHAFTPGREIPTPPPITQASSPSPDRQTHTRQSQRESQASPPHPSAQAPEKRILRPRKRAADVLGPSEDGGAKKLCKDGGVKKPSKDKGAKKPSKNAEVKKPSQNRRVNKPSKNEGVKKPSKDAEVKKSSKDEGVKKPSQDEGVEKPSTEPRYRLRSYTRYLQ
ncbi:hypothetical protein F5Y14DRAFT_223652 [Nemania sp. NC0429]|nr:hypothetical protein F5Y14DRAFT_223652 [Nemania sp. NC0429]